MRQDQHFRVQWVHFLLLRQDRTGRGEEVQDRQGHHGQGAAERKSGERERNQAGDAQR